MYFFSFKIPSIDFLITLNPQILFIFAPFEKQHNNDYFKRTECYIAN